MFLYAHLFVATKQTLYIEGGSDLATHSYNGGVKSCTFTSELNYYFCSCNVTDECKLAAGLGGLQQTMCKETNQLG